MSTDPNMALYQQFLQFQQQRAQSTDTQGQGSPQQGDRPLTIVRQPSTAANCLYTIPSKVLEEAEREAGSERDLIKRLCLLLKPTDKDFFPALLRLTLANPGEVTSSQTLRGRLITAAKRLHEEHGTLFKLLQHSKDYITPDSLGIQNQPLMVDFVKMAATLAARLVGRWAILGRVDMYRNKTFNKERFNGVELVVILKQLSEDWLVGDVEPINQNVNTRMIGRKNPERQEN